MTATIKTTNLQHESAATANITLTSGGNVGIGTSSPDYNLDVSGTTDPRIILQSTGTASTDDTIFINRVGGTTATNQIWFGDSGSASTGKLQYDHSNNAMTFHTNGGTERMRIDSSGNLKFNSGYGSAATAYGCRAWVNFNGAGTPSIRGSGNISSVTDTAVGKFTVSFSTAMSDLNYTVVGGGGQVDVTLANLLVATHTSTSVFYIQFSTGAANIDPPQAMLAIFR